MTAPATTSVLIIDDESDTLTYLHEVLSAEGFRVATSSDPWDGLRTAEQFRPDVVVLDYRMPSLNGLEVLSRLRRACPQARVCLFTAYPDEEVVRRAVELGAVEIFAKPATRRKVLEVIRRALRQAAEP
jgi:DNA-binding response OmpR family regulator